VDKYDWKNDSLDPFDAIKTCEVLGNRTVLLIGDSTMGQTASTLMNRIKAGGRIDQIQFGEADTLTKKNMGHLNRGFTWSQHVERVNPDIMTLV